MPPTTYSSIDVDGLSVFYCETGSPGAPTLPLLHGFPSSSRMGRFAPSFQVEEAEAYRRDVPRAELRILDAGHFALDERPDTVARLTRKFLSFITRSG